MQPDTPVRILVADDEQSIREVIRDFLTLERYEVVDVADGEQALARLQSEPFDILLTDLEMPRVNGLELLRRIRSLDQRPLPIIMTGYATVENAVEAMRVGAHDYILKPFKIDEVVHTIRMAREKLELERENLSLRQAVSVYHVAEALTLSLPVETMLDIVIDLLVQELGLDAAAVVFDGSLRKRRTRIGERGEDLLAQLDWKRMAAEFEAGRTVLAGGEAAQAYFAGMPVESVVAVPLTARKRLAGGLIGVSVTPRRRFQEGDRRLMTVVATQAAAAVDNVHLYRDLQHTVTSTIEGLVIALEAKDEYTAGHSQRVARWAEIIALQSGLEGDEVERVVKGALLHDIGKIGVDEEALRKAGKLTPEEFQAFQSHPVISRRILEPLRFLGPVVDYVAHHHERFDGQGYPGRLLGDAIPLGARIICLADSFEVMSTDRAYRKRLPREIALAELRRCAGTQFDPRLVEVFLRYLEGFSTFREAMENESVGRPDALIADVLG